jgi:hypothetical protein
VTVAHDQSLTLRLLCHIPEHEPRKGDPHYAVFNATKRRMRAAGLLRCAIAGCTYPGPIELNHSKIEFSLQGGVDLGTFDDVWGLALTAEEFADYIEGPGNLEPLCPVHHRTHLGVHALPEPFWQAVRVWRADMAPPAEHVTN